MSNNQLSTLEIATSQGLTTIKTFFVHNMALKGNVAIGIAKCIGLSYLETYKCNGPFIVEITINLESKEKLG